MYAVGDSPVLKKFATVFGKIKLGQFIIVVVNCSFMSASSVTPWTVARCQAPLSMEFSRQEYWSG